MNQSQRTLTASAHVIAIPATNPNVCAGDINVARLCIYNYLEE